MKKIAPLALALVALPFAAGCGGPMDAASADHVAELESTIASLEKQNAEWESRFRNLERRMEGTSRDIAALHKGRAAPGAAAVAGAAEAVSDVAADAPSDAPQAAMSPAAQAFGEFLQSESGQDALSNAVEQANRRRDRQRFARMAEGMIDRFAQEANLTDEQATRMKELSANLAGKMSDAFAAMRGPEEGTPEERAEARAAAMQQVTTLREQMNEDVKLILNAEQYSMYEENMSRMRGFGGGGGGRGGFGGRGGRDR